MGESIGKGRAQDKHNKELDEIDIEREDLPQFIDDIVQATKETEGGVIALSGNQTAFTAPDTGTIVVHDPNHPDLDTVFRPRPPDTGASTLKQYIENFQNQPKQLDASEIHPYCEDAVTCVYS
ncbi:hypothetical protein [Myxococcus sp. NMCA1]|uniref:hypothetical protein n=1 Tax=Myxococcus sp. NMCA1 TaxID=2996785 RepID=UPI0022865E1C|nr:hypothetical protein [Myxococcus sp. NMCA1]WAM24887.1 hypothetical protein OZ403_30805 [Myxococcus sp. NMCA1]